MTLLNQLRGTLTHELGHWVAAKRLGFEVGGIEISYDGVSVNGWANILPQPDIKNLEAARTYIEQRIVVLYSGLMAEYFDEIGHSSERINELAELSAQDDWQKVNELGLLLRGILYSGSISIENEIEHRNAIAVDLWSKAYELVKGNLGVINDMTDDLSRRIVRGRNFYKFADEEVERLWTSLATKIG